MSTREDELEDFKRKISLAEYAAELGYLVDRRASSRNCVAMKGPDGNKIVIGMGHDEHWIYFSVNDPSDSGSIIDFVQQRQGMNLGQVRRELRPRLDHQSNRPASALPATSIPRPEPVVVDLSTVQEAYAAAEGLGASSGYHAYLCDERAVPASLLASGRFAGRVRSDALGNAIFPHWNRDKQICGFEKKNKGFTGFSSHGTKGLWCSAAQDTDRRMVIAETTIDALSYAALKGYGDARFFSIAGQMNPSQPALLNLAMQKMPTGSTIVLAVDHDDGGQAIAEYIEPIFLHVRDKLGRGDLQLVTDTPEIPGQDWNDVLRGRGDPHRPAASPLPA